MSTHNPTATVISQQLHSETINGRSFQAYPPATAEYEDVAQSSDLFWEKLEAFHKSFGTKFKVPTVGGHALDLHRLFVEVTSRGGIEKVIKERKWKEVIAVFNFPTTITSASFVLRKYYLSLLYHFEQVYQFHKQSPSVSTPVSTDTINGSLGNESVILDEGAAADQLAGNLELPLGCTVTGIIDGKFDNGYLVTVNLGFTQLKGVIYHVPQSFQEYQNSHNKDASPRRRRKRSRFSEHYAQLKPLHNAQEKIISKKIGHLWNNNPTEGEKQVHQEKGMRDKKREGTEILEYRSAYVQ